MKRLGWRGTTFVISSLFFVLLVALACLLDTEPPKEMRVVQGVISSRVAIETKGRLTGFRFCVGDPVMTFTYLDPDPDVKAAWSAMQGAVRARVRYAPHPTRNPTLWGLDVDGHTIATRDELAAARSTRLGLLLAGIGLSGGTALALGISWARRARKR